MSRHPFPRALGSRRRQADKSKTARLTLSRVRTDQRRLEKALQTLLGLGEAKVVGSLITLEAYADLRGLSPATVKSQIKSTDPKKRHAHPVFRAVRGTYLTDENEIAAWYESLAEVNASPLGRLQQLREVQRIARGGGS